MEENTLVKNQELIVTGLITEVREKREGISAAGRAWAVQEYVLQSSGEYQKSLLFEVFGDERINRFNIQKGDMVTIACDVESRQWRDRYITSVKAFRCEKDQAPNANYITPQNVQMAQGNVQAAIRQAQQPQQPQQNFANAPKVGVSNNPASDPDALPF